MFRTKNAIKILTFCIVVFSLVLPLFSQTDKSNNNNIAEEKTREHSQDSSVTLIAPKDELERDISGNDQFGTVYTLLGEKLTVRAVDKFGDPVQDVKVFFKITSQPSKATKEIEVIPSADVTDEDGIFKVSCHLGNAVGVYKLYFYAEGHYDSGFEFIATAKKKSWLTFIFLGVCGGLAILLYGMQLGAGGLQKLAGGKIRGIISDLTKNRFVAVAVGAIVTFFTQSSSASTVMFVSFVRARLMTLRQSIGLIFGAAIGTTITVQLISLNITEFALPIIAVGVFLLMVLKRKRMRNIGTILLGFGLIFFGIAVMSDKVAPLRAYPLFRNAIEALSERPIMCMILAAVFTAIIQSSGATLGIAIALASQDLISLRGAIPIIFGANIGTTATALLASIGATCEARRVAWAHFLFKVIGVLIFLPFLLVLNFIGTRTSPDIARQIANTHTIFNVLSAALFLFFIPQFVKLVEWLIPTEPVENEALRSKYLDLQILDTPPIALGSSIREISRMARFIEEMMHYVIRAIINKEENLIDIIKQREEKVNYLFNSLNHYLTSLAQRSLSDEDSAKCISLLYIINDLQSIGDIVDMNISPLAEKMIDNNVDFSEEGKADLRDLHKKVVEDLNAVVIAITSFDENISQKVIDNKREIRRYGRRLHLKHLKRLSEGLPESIDTSSIHIDVINHFLRIEHHIITIASSIKYRSKASEFQHETE